MSSSLCQAHCVEFNQHENANAVDIANNTFVFISLALPPLQDKELLCKTEPTLVAVLFQLSLCHTEPLLLYCTYTKEWCVVRGAPICTNPNSALSASVASRSKSTPTTAFGIALIRIEMPSLAATAVSYFLGIQKVDRWVLPCLDMG